MVDADVLSLLEQVWVGSLGLNQGTQPSYRAQHPTFLGKFKFQLKLSVWGLSSQTGAALGVGSCTDLRLPAVTEEEKSPLS